MHALTTSEARARARARAPAPAPRPRHADLERCCRPDAILASNTSTISLELVGGLIT